MKYGFALVELLVALLIASIIGVTLFISLDQANRTGKQVENLIEVHEKIALCVHQLERDISGAFIPAQPGPDKKDNPKDQKQQEEQPAAQQKVTQEPKKQFKKITHIFYGTNQEGNLDTLTCITNNPMQVYWSTRAGKAKPRIARVVYRLVPEKGTAKPSFALMRQEDTVLDIDAYKPDAATPIRSYELINGIKQMSIKYGAEIEKGEQKEAKSDAQKKKPETTWQVFDDWNIENQKDKKRPKVPQELEITVSIWDVQKVKDVTVVCKIAIIPDLQEGIQKQAKDKKTQELGQQKQLIPGLPPQKQAHNGSKIHDLLGQFLSGNPTSRSAT